MRTLTNSDRLYLRGVENIMKRYATASFFPQMQSIYNDFMSKDVKTYSEDEIMQFNIAIQGCVEVKLSSVSNEQLIGSMIEAIKDSTFTII